MQKFRSFKNLALASLFLVKSSLLAPVHTFGQVDDALAEMRNHIQTILVNKTHVENTVGGCEKEVATIRAKLQQAQTDAIAAAKQQFTNEYDALQTMQQDLSHEMAVVNAHIENAEATIRTKADEIRQSNEARLQTALQTHRANFDDLKDSVYEDLEGVIDQAEKEAREVRDRQWSEFQASKSRIDNACEAESKVRRQRFDQELEKIEAVKKDVTEKVLDGLRETVEQAFNTGELTRDTLNKLPEIMADAVGTAVDAASKDSSKSFGDALKENFSPEMVKALSDEKVGKNFGKSLIDGMVNSTAFKDMVKKMTEDAAKGKAEGWVGGNKKNNTLLKVLMADPRS